MEKVCSTNVHVQFLSDWKSKKRKSNPQKIYILDFQFPIFRVLATKTKKIQEKEETEELRENSFQIVLCVKSKISNEEEVDSITIIYSRRFVRRINTYTFVSLWGRIYTKSWALVALLPKVILKRFFCVFPRFYRCSSYLICVPSSSYSFIAHACIYA